MTDNTVHIRRKARGRCPICGRPAATDYRPFCSARCSDRDLGNWLMGSYTIPTEERIPDEASPADDEETEF